MEELERLIKILPQLETIVAATRERIRELSEKLQAFEVIEGGRNEIG